MSVRDSTRNGFCFICGHHEYDRAHIISRGAGGSDEPHNIMFLCRKHHSEQHYIGWTQFIKKYHSLKKELLYRGFEYCKLRKRWTYNLR